MSDQPQSNESMIKIVVIAVAVNTTIGVSTLGYCLLLGVHADAVLLTAYVGLAGTLSGYLGGMLTKTTPTQTTTEKPTGTVTVPEQKLDTTQT